MSTETAAPSFAERMIMGTLIYYTPILICLGIIGNCLSVCIFCRKNMRHLTSSFYLAALATSDNGYLITIMIHYLKTFNVNVFAPTIFCKFYAYSTMLWSSLSVWLVVAFTVERFIGVCYPFHRKSICTVARAKRVIIGTTILAVLLISPLLFMVRSKDALWYRSPCSVVEEWKHFLYYFTIIRIVTVFVVPFTLIVLLNGLIVKTIWRRNGFTTTPQNSGTNFIVENSSSGQCSNDSIAQRKITMMLLTVSSVFLCLNLPVYACKAYLLSQGKLHTGEHSETVQSVQLLFDRMFDTSFGINFFLYCISGENWQQEVMRMLFHWPRRSCSSKQGKHWPKRSDRPEII